MFGQPLEIPDVAAAGCRGSRATHTRPIRGVCARYTCPAFGAALTWLSAWLSVRTVASEYPGVRDRQRAAWLAEPAPGDHQHR
jgi:hypothetical protein